MNLDELQAEAVHACIDPSKRVVPITGPAGTGKTTIMKQVYHALREAGYNVAAGAPTGKAAKRISEATGIPAATLHRLLKYTHPGEPDEETGKVVHESYPRHDRTNPMPYDVILIDEYAMVNWEVHNNLFNAIKGGGRVCIFGDVNQLKPVEGNDKVAAKPTPFMTLLSKFDGIHLTTIHRQGEGSDIVAGANMILNGRMPVELRGSKEFSVVFTDRPVHALSDTVMELLDDEGVHFGTAQHQIIVQQKTKFIGTERLNPQLQLLLRPENDGWLDVPRHKWVKASTIRMRADDKIMCTKNNYDLRNEEDRWEYHPGQYTEEGHEARSFIPVPDDKWMMNGEQGIIKSIHPEFGVEFDVGDRIVAVPGEQFIETREGHIFQNDPRRDLDLAYAITCHKAQGSEWDTVIYVMNKATLWMQSRRNLYTAVTRARKRVILITDQRSLATSVNKRD